MSAWNSVVEKVTPYIVRIDTPTGHGTGFLFAYNATQKMCAIATAHHVIENADQWQQPIRIHNYDFSQRILLKEDLRVVLKNPANDSAVIWFPVHADLDLPKVPIQLRPVDALLTVGDDIGWLGFPAVDSNTLCFFSGSVSARPKGGGGYLIDGVAIHGVSGGPVLYSTSHDGVQVVGIVTAYMVNRQRGESLPGLAIAQDVSYFHQAIRHIKDWDDLMAKRAQQEAEKQKPVTVTEEAKPAPSDPKPQAIEPDQPATTESA